MKGKKALSDGSTYCERCNVYYPPYLWRKGAHVGSKRCDKALLEKPLRDKAMQGALSDVNRFLVKER